MLRSNPFKTLLAAARSTGSLADWLAVTSDPGATAGMWLQAVRASQVRGDRENARMFAERGLVRFRANLPLLLASAKEQILANNLPLAIERLQTYFATDERAGFNLIAASFDKGRLLQTACCFVAMERQYPKSSEALVWRVRLLTHLGEAEGKDSSDAADVVREHGSPPSAKPT